MYICTYAQWLLEPPRGFPNRFQTFHDTRLGNPVSKPFPNAHSGGVSKPFPNRLPSALEGFQTVSKPFPKLRQTTVSKPFPTDKIGLETLQLGEVWKPFGNPLGGSKSH